MAHIKRPVIKTLYLTKSIVYLGHKNIHSGVNETTFKVDPGYCASVHGALITNQSRHVILEREEFNPTLERRLNATHWDGYTTTEIHNGDFFTVLYDSHDPKFGEVLLTYTFTFFYG